MGTIPLSGIFTVIQKNFSRSVEAHCELQIFFRLFFRLREGELFRSILSGGIIICNCLLNTAILSAR